MSAEIRKIRDGAPLLSDIPGMLRHLAADIEKGEFGNLPSVMVVVPEDEDFPTVLQFGEEIKNSDMVLQFELAKLWLLNNLVGTV